MQQLEEATRLHCLSYAVEEQISKVLTAAGTFFMAFHGVSGIGDEDAVFDPILCSRFCSRFFSSVISRSRRTPTNDGSKFNS